VTGAQLSTDKRSFELHTSEASPFEQHFYRMPVAGGARERITTKVGGHNVVVSPDGALLADVYSSANRPPELFVMPYRAVAVATQLTTWRASSTSRRTIPLRITDRRQSTSRRGSRIRSSWRTGWWT